MRDNLHSRSLNKLLATAQGIEAILDDPLRHVKRTAPTFFLRPAFPELCLTPPVLLCRSD
jgi:hypothetical protein